MTRTSSSLSSTSPGELKFNFKLNLKSPLADKIPFDTESELEVTVPQVKRCSTGSNGRTSSATTSYQLLDS